MPHRQHHKFTQRMDTIPPTLHALEQTASEKGPCTKQGIYIIMGSITCILDFYQRICWVGRDKQMILHGSLFQKQLMHVRKSGTIEI